MVSEIGKYIFLFLIGTTLLNLAIAITARAKTRHQEFTLLIMYWAALFVTFFISALLSSNETQIAFAFFFQLIPFCLAANILANSRGIKLDWKYIVPVQLLGMGTTTYMLLYTNLGFTVSLLPLMTAAAIPYSKPIYNTLITDRTQSNWVEKGIAFIMFTGIIHNFNYAFFRLDESSAYWGWAVSIVQYQCLSIFLPLLINIKREKKEIKNLESTLEKISGKHAIYGADVDELYNHLEIQIAQKEQYLNALKSANLSLEEEREMNEVLIKTISHDLANPLTVVNAYMDMLKSGKVPSDDSKRLWDRMQMNMDHALNMIIRIRQAIVTRSQANFLTIKPIDLSIVLRRSCMLFEERLKEKNIKLNVNYELDDQFMVMGDENALSEHILANVLSNAVKFSFENSQIDIHVRDLDNQVEIEVRDFGVGIDNDRLDKKQFSSKPGTKGEEGTGFGIIVMGYFVRKFDATVEYINKNDHRQKGTSVILRLKKPDFFHRHPIPSSDSAANIYS